MADINPANRTSIAAYAQRVQALGRTGGRLNQPANDLASGPVRGSDAVEVSTHARLLSKLQDTPEIRQDVVDRVKGLIEDGIYESPDKINAAVDGLLEDLSN